MKPLNNVLGAVALIIAVIAFHHSGAVQAASKIPVMQAIHTEEPIKVDGKLDEAIWKKARVYRLALGADRAATGKALKEPGEVRLAWDADHLYVGVDWVDSEVVAKGTKDHEYHFMLGDLCELFLKPENKKRYWELYATPAQKKSCFWFKQRGAKLQIDRDFGLRVAAHVKGTLNDGKGNDRGWSAEMAVPREDLTRHGAKFGPGSSWRILVARYNYSTGEAWKTPELSMTPKLSRTNYHSIDEYARLEFVR